jgi:Protein of unknown function (DUF2637)
MLQPTEDRRSHLPVQIHYLHQAEPTHRPASVLALETLGRMHPATAITLVLTVAGMAAGTVVAIVALVATVLATVAAIVGTVAIAGLGLAVAAIVLGGRGPPAADRREREPMPTTKTLPPPVAEAGGTATPPVPPPMRSITDPSVQAADAWLRRFQAALVTIMAAFALGVGAVAFFTSFEAIRAYAKGSGGITPAHAWAIPLLVDSFIVIATGAELWLGVHPARRAWWELAWPRALLAGAAAVSFVLNVAHAEAGDWPARGVAAIPPAALVLSVELLVLIARRAALARTHRLTTAAQPGLGGATLTEVVWGDQSTTTMAATGDRPALEATSSVGDHPTTPTGDRLADGAGDQPTIMPAKQTPTTATAGTATSASRPDGATYQRVRDLYLGGVTVAAHIARELGVSASYAQRTLRRVKADLARQQQAPATGPGRATIPGRDDQTTTNDQARDQAEVAARAHDHPNRAEPQRGDQATRDGDGRTTTPSPDRHLMLVAPDRDQHRGEAER